MLNRRVRSRPESCTSELQLKVNCRINFWPARPTVGRPAHIFSYNSLSVYNSLSAAIHLYMIRPIFYRENHRYFRASNRHTLGNYPDIWQYRSGHMRHEPARAQAGRAMPITIVNHIFPVLNTIYILMLTSDIFLFLCVYSKQYYYCVHLYVNSTERIKLQYLGRY